MSDNDEVIIDTRTRILNSAENVFVEKGYDGARVDEIAKNAKINKAQLFYHFGSKENILKEVLRKNINEAAELIEDTFDEVKVNSTESFSGFVDGMFTLFKKKENILRIIMMETFKSGSKDVAIFEILEPLYRKIQLAAKNMGIETKSSDSSLISYFFLDMMPLLLFITFKDKFAEYYDIPGEKLDEKFKEQYMAIQMRYFEKINVKINIKKDEAKSSGASL